MTGKRRQLRDHILQLLVDRHKQSFESLQALLVARHQAWGSPGLWLMLQKWFINGDSWNIGNYSMVNHCVANGSPVNDRWWLDVVLSWTSWFKISFHSRNRSSVVNNQLNDQITSVAGLKCEKMNERQMSLILGALQTTKKNCYSLAFFVSSIFGWLAWNVFWHPRVPLEDNDPSLRRDIFQERSAQGILLGMYRYAAYIA